MFGPIFCSATCCAAGGPFDFYGAIHGSDAASELLYRSASVIPAGEATPYLSTEHAEPWAVLLGDVADPPQEAVIQMTLAPHAGSERCWIIRFGNPEHPDSNVGPEKFSNRAVGSWTKGAEARYTAEFALETETDADTDEVTLTHGVSLAADKNYRFGLVAKKRDVRWVRVEIHDFDAVTGSSVFYFDLDDTAGAIQVDIDKWEWTQLLTTSVGGPGGSPAVEIRLVSSGSDDSYDGTDGDGSHFYTASFRELGVDFAAHAEVFLVDCESQTVLQHVYPRVHLPVSFNDPFLFESQHAAVLANAPFRVGNARVWCSESSLGFPGAYSIYVIGGSSVGERHGEAIAASVDHEDFESYTPELYSYGPFGNMHFPGAAAARNEAADLPYIIGTPPHDFPRVVGYVEARPVWFEIERCLPVPEAEEDPLGLGVGRYKTASQVSIASKCAVTYGGYSLVSKSFTVVTDYPDFPELEGEILYDADLIVGSTSELWSHTHTTPRLVVVPQSQSMTPEDPNYGTGTPVDDAVWLYTCDPQAHLDHTILRWCGHAGSGGAIIFYTKYFYEITSGTVPWIAADHPEDPFGLNEPTEGLDYTEMYLAVVAGGSTVYEQQIWQFAEAEEGNPVTRYQGLGACKNGGWVYFERLWITEPTEEAPGTFESSGWRLHGPGGWTIDNEYPDDNPDFVTSSDRHIFIKGFTMCDVRLDGNSAESWAISVDGQYAWPIRQVVDGAGDNVLNLAGVAPAYGSFIRDSIKNSAAIPLTPAIDQWADRDDVQYVDEHAESPTANAHASYSGDRLSVTVDTETSQAELFWSNASTSPARRFRIVIEAEDDEINALACVFLSLGGVDEFVWLNLVSGAINSPTLPTFNHAVTDLGGGRFRFSFEIEPPIATSVVLGTRLVSGIGDETLAAGHLDDGAFIYSVSISAKCV